MTEHDVIRYMGRFPDAINPEKRMMSEIWSCSKCENIVRANAGTQIPIPAPCIECGSIFFESKRDYRGFGNA